jgi:Mitochondrial mRNA-processing protein COX24, C-terminal
LPEGFFAVLFEPDRHGPQNSPGHNQLEVCMGSVIKKRRKRMAKKKHRKLLRKTRHQRRNKK